MKDNEYNQLRDIKGIGAKRYDAIVSILNETGMALDDLFSMSATAIKEQFRLPINVAKAIVSTSKTDDKPKTKKTEKTVINLSIDKNIRILNLEDDEYPERLKQILGKKAAPKLHVWGNLELLTKPAVGFCGSRNVSQKGIDVTADIAEQVIEWGGVVISGHARGVDATAHRVALENGGGTIIVVPQGINTFKLRRELKNTAKPEQILIISEFSPDAGWHVGHAMKRNKTIIGLSDAMVLIEARSKGGTFEAGKQALALKVPLYVARYKVHSKDNDGNTYFLNRHATEILRNPETNRARLDALQMNIEHRRTVFQKTEKVQQLQLIL
jgi:DNA processing protein